MRLPTSQAGPCTDSLSLRCICLLLLSASSAPLALQVHLTPLLHLLPVFHDPAHLLTLGRALGALQQCQRELCGWYSTEVPALVARQNGMPQ
jgi:hypothetical protein